jgi:cytochrome c
MVTFRPSRTKTRARRDWTRFKKWVNLPLTSPTHSFRPKERTMKTRHLFILSCGLLLSGTALADEALLRKSGCFACHTVDKKLVGPALKDIAAKYSGTKGAVDTLAKKVRAGGSGTWGTTPMAPAPATVSDADLKASIAYILTLK